MLTQSQSILVVHLFSRKKTHQPFNSIYWSPWDLLGISKHEIPIQNHIVFDTINNRGRAKNIENSFVITSNFTIILNSHVEILLYVFDMNTFWIQYVP